MLKHLYFITVLTIKVLFHGTTTQIAAERGIKLKNIESRLYYFRTPLGQYFNEYHKKH